MADRYGIPPSGYRLPTGTRLGAVHLQVCDLGRSVAFYEQVLGLRAIARRGAEAALAAAGSDEPLITLLEKAGARPVPRGGLLGLYHFAVLVPDRATLGRFVAHLSDIHIPAGTADHAVSEAVYISDPDGLGIEVYADRPRDTWRFDASRELFMTTAPLNVRAVIAAGGGVGWSALPAGTRIGHVHLHVAALPEAAAFYHTGLGFDKMVWSYPGALFLSAGGYHHHLGTNTWSSGGPAGEDNARLLWWDVVVPQAAEAAAAAESVARAGYPVTAGSREWIAADPWGTRVRIVAGNIEK